MMDPLGPTLRLTTPIGLGNQAYLEGTEALIQRLTLVLTTRRGDLPWAPDFGCSLDDLIGLPASPGTLARARLAIEQALDRWLSGLVVEQCSVQLTHQRDDLVAPEQMSPMENSLFQLGVTAGLEVALDLRLSSGRISLTFELNE